MWHVHWCPPLIWVLSFIPHSYISFSDVLVTTPNRLIYLLNQEPPAVDLSRSVHFRSTKGHLTRLQCKPNPIISPAGFVVLCCCKLSCALVCLCAHAPAWSGWWWTSPTSCSRTVRPASGSSWPPSSWPAPLRKFAALSSAPLSPQRSSSGANSTWTISSPWTSDPGVKDVLYHLSDSVVNSGFTTTL